MNSFNERIKVYNCIKNKLNNLRNTQQLIDRQWKRWLNKLIDK